MQTQSEVLGIEMNQKMGQISLSLAQLIAFLIQLLVKKCYYKFCPTPIYISKIWAHGTKFVGALLKFDAYLGSLVNLLCIL